MKRTGWFERGSLLVLIAAATCSPSLASAQSLALKETPPLAVDQNGGAVATLTLVNDSTTPVKLRLNLSDFTHPAPDKTTPYPLGTTHMLSAVSDKDKPILDGTVALAAGATLDVRVTVAKLWEAGQSEARLKNGDADIPVRGGPPRSLLKAVRIPTAYNVQIVSATPDTPEIHFIGNQALVAFKNTDPFNYRFTWKLRLGGQLYDGEQRIIDPPAGGTRWVYLTSPDLRKDFPRARWLTAGTLKDEISKGTLILQPVFEGDTVIPPLAPKDVPVTFRFSYWTNATVQQLWNGLWIFLLLMVGGIVSIGIHHGIPNATRALALKKRLGELETKVQGLGEMIESRRRVMLEAHLPAIRGELASVFVWVLPSFTATLDTLAGKVDMVQQWVEIAYQAGVVKHRAGESSERIPSTVYRWIHDKCAAALTPIESGFTTSDELAAMKANLKTAESYLDVSLDRLPNTALEKEIREREARLAPLLPALTTTYPRLAGLVKQVPDKETPLTPMEYIYRDNASLKVDLLQTYDRRVQQLTAAAGDPVEARTRLDTPSSPLLDAPSSALMKYLAADTHESLRIAEMVVTQMRQDVYTTALVAELNKKPPTVTITTHPARIEAKTPVMLALRFNRDLLNEASARLEWKCLWNFGDGSPPETGWEVFHSYEMSGTPKVQVTIVDLEALPVAPAVQLENKLTVRAPRRFRPSPETRLELARTGIVLAVALIGLMATAWQQVESLSFLGAVGAMIALGFGVDVLKNLALPRPSSG
jgi:hypothetical protein